MFNDSFDDIWSDYYSTVLTKRETNQFRQACRRPASAFLEQIIKPMAFEPSKRTYMCVADNQHVEGRSHFPVADLVQGANDDVAWNCHQFFTNVLKIANPDDPDFGSPMDRVVMGDFHVFTMEFDGGGLPFFQQQLAWFRSPNNLLDAPIGRFLKDLRSEFKDCVGLNVTYSGNKSFHYHIVFATDLIAGRVDGPTSVRYGFTQAWEKLAGLMKASPHLNIPADIHPDPTNRHPEWFRRLPNGVRTLAAPRNKAEWKQFFGVPVGEIVPQTVMWEHIATTRSGRGKDQASLFEPSNFNLSIIPSHQRKASHKAVEFQQGGAVEEYVRERMTAIFPGFRDDGTQAWPKFEGFTHQRGELRALFTNSVGDRHPTSYMSEGFATVFIQGDNPYGLTNTGEGRMPRLPKSLGEMIERWTAEYQALNGPAPTLSDRSRTTLEQKFADEAKDHASATSAIAGVLDDLVLGNRSTSETHFLSAPEGISKTRSLIAQTPRYHYNLTLQQRSPLIMYAFGSYEMAAEKAAEFSATHRKDTLIHGHRYIGVVLPSFSQLYKEACEALKVSPITPAVAAQNGFSSMMAAIAAMQPEAITHFRRFYHGLWRQIGDRVPVIFTVHQVAHSWIKNSPTRLMFWPDYWAGEPGEDPQDRHARLSRCRKNTKLGMLIHDEVSADNLLLAVPAHLVAWVEMAKEAAPSAWATNSTLAERFEAFEAFRAVMPPPMDIDYERAAEIADIDDWDIVETAYSGEYGAPQERRNAKTGETFADIYSATSGTPWAVHVRPWPTQTAFKTIVLTTESVPAHIVRKIATGWTVTELDTPLIPRDVVETYPLREVTADKLGKLVKEWQADHRAECGRELEAISNKAKHVSRTKSHASAKGSNGYMGCDVIQTMAMMPPQQFEFYEALNAWTGRDDMVRARHMDEFNQSAGRNLGFRKRGAPKHILLINARLSECLDGEPKARARYVMQEVLTRRQTSAAKAAAKAPSAAVTPSQAKLAALRAQLVQP